MEISDLSNSVIFKKGEPLPEQFNKYFVGQMLSQYAHTF